LRLFSLEFRELRLEGKPFLLVAFESPQATKEKFGRKAGTWIAVKSQAIRFYFLSLAVLAFGW
jgi:hypothetical protein